MAGWIEMLKRMAQSPARVGALSPSSRFLADSMVRAADLRDRHVVAELGAGTGSITRRIRERAPRAPLLALEPDGDLAGVLREEVPDVDVVERWAQELPEVVSDWGHDRVDRVLSGLPWTLWSQEIQQPVLDAVTQTLRPSGRFVTFTYVPAQVLPGSVWLRRNLLARFGRVRRTPVQWANLPPAFVYVCDEPNHPAAPAHRPTRVAITRRPRIAR